MEWRLADYLQIAAKTYVDVYVSHRHVVPELTPSWGSLEREWGRGGVGGKGVEGGGRGDEGGVVTSNVRGCTQAPSSYLLQLHKSLTSKLQLHSNQGGEDS